MSGEGLGADKLDSGLTIGGTSYSESAEEIDLRADGLRLASEAKLLDPESSKVPTIRGVANCARKDAVRLGRRRPHRNAAECPAGGFRRGSSRKRRRARRARYQVSTCFRLNRGQRDGHFLVEARLDWTTKSYDV
jgi:hypothetical protein